MKLVNFSVSNFRSITTAHKVSLSDTTVLIGRNNEGKSNLLKALDVAMTFLKRHATASKYDYFPRRLLERDESSYYWERDFPVNLQLKFPKKQTTIRLEFYLTGDEINEFKSIIKTNLNGTLPIIIKIGRDNRPVVEVSKRGKGTKKLNAKSDQIADFVANKILFNYIPAVRTEQEALAVVNRMLSMHLRPLEDHPEYRKALSTIRNLQKPILDGLSETIKKPLKEFLPGIKDVKIEIPERPERSFFRKEVDIIIDDGTPTNLSFKGDGIKSLAALSLLKNKVRKGGASIVAIEEPESHLHPSAIHQLNSVIQSLARENQTILTTHNPLFVDRENIKSNIIVDAGKAAPARDVKQIRNLLGVRASDNLVNARFVLVVEGEEDVNSLKVLLSIFSEKIKRQLVGHLFVIDSMGGAGNLPYKLTLLKNALCVYHTFLDNDQAGRLAFESSVREGLLSIKNNTFVNCNGLVNSEFEDCLNVSVYRERVKDEFGVDLSKSEFRNNKSKWSDRVKSSFLSQGKPWNGKVQRDVKRVVSDCVVADPKNAIHPSKKSIIDALVVALESLFLR